MDQLLPPKKKAIIVDLDGTLADLNGRKPYGNSVRDECLDDLCIGIIAEVVHLFYHYTNKQVLLVSGRSDDACMETSAWLRKHHIDYDHLWMRKEGDYRPDEILKEEIYREKIEPFYDVELVFDDRPKIVRMWREIGLKVADVGKGIEF